MYKSDQFKARLERATKRRNYQTRKQVIRIIELAMVAFLAGSFVLTIYYIAWRQIDYRVCTTASPTLAQQLKCN